MLDSMPHPHFLDLKYFEHYYINYFDDILDGMDYFLEPLDYRLDYSGNSYKKVINSYLIYKLIIKTKMSRLLQYFSVARKLLV